MQFVVEAIKGKMICWRVGGWICLPYPSKHKLSFDVRVYELKPFKIHRLKLVNDRIVAEDEIGTVLKEWEKEDLIGYE